MSRIYFFLITVGLLISCGRADEASLQSSSVIPLPAEVKSGSGNFELANNTAISIPQQSEEWKNISSYLIGLLQPATGFQFTVQNGIGEKVFALNPSMKKNWEQRAIASRSMKN